MRNEKGDGRGRDLTERGDDLLREKFEDSREKISCYSFTGYFVNLLQRRHKKPHVVCLQG